MTVKGETDSVDMSSLLCFQILWKTSESKKRALLSYSLAHSLNSLISTQLTHFKSLKNKSLTRGSGRT
jgi:hypothetical protein